MQSIPAKYLTAVILLAILAITFLVYVPGLDGQFIFDDTVNIERNQYAQLEAFTWEELSKVWNSGIASDLGRPVAMLSFGLNYFFSGLDPWWYKLTNIVIHLLTACALYFLTCELLRTDTGHASRFKIKENYLALIITSVWALHPLHVSTVLYTVQRMTELAALFSILALYLYCRFRRALTLTNRQIAGALLIVGLLILISTLSKENGILTVALIGAVELFIFRLKTTTHQQRNFQRAYLLLFLIIPAIVTSLYLALHPEFIVNLYQYRDFTLTQRLMSEARILWSYIGWVLLPDPRNFLFFHENYQFSTGLLQPISTLFAAVGILGLLVFSWLFRERMRWLSFGISFFLIGHALESTVFPLELVFEHRNYLPSFGLLFGIIATLFDQRTVILQKPVGLAFCALILLLNLEGTSRETRKWSSTPRFLLTLLDNSPNSRRLHYELGHMYLRLGMSGDTNEAYLKQAQQAFARSSELEESLFNALIGLILTNNYLHEPVTPELLEKLQFRITNYPINNGGFIEIINLTRCYMAQACLENPDILIATYQALVANEHLSIRSRQALLNQIATDTIDNFNRFADALAISYYAAQLSSELTLIDIRIIILELELGNIAAAKSHMSRAKAKTTEEEELLLDLMNLEEQIAIAEERIEKGA